MRERDFYRLRVVVSNDSALSDIHIEAEIKEYFWLSSMYEHELDAKLTSKVKKAVRIIGDVHMIDIELVRSSTAWGAHEVHIDSYRIVQRGYPRVLVMSRHNGASTGAVFDFDNAPVVEIADVISQVKRLQKHAFSLWKKEWTREGDSL